MPANKPAEDERAPLNFDIPEDIESEDSPEVTRQKIREANKKGGWERATRRAPANAEPEIPQNPVTQQKRERRRRHTTGRTYPFSTKIKEEIYDKIIALSDKATEREHRPVGIAEIIERAIENLDRAEK
jgi:hypothetical protein